MTGRGHDPDGVAPELWADAENADSASELVRALSPIAERYSNYYDIPFEAAVYRAAGESLDWWPHGSPRKILWTPDVLQLLLYPENVSFVVDHIEESWEQCLGWEDSLTLIDEAALGTGVLQMGPPELGREGSFSPEPQFSRPASRAGEDWSRVLDIDVTSRHGPMKRAGELLKIVDTYVEELNMSREAAVREVVRTYVDVQEPSTVFYEAMKLRWDPYLDPLDERFATEWDEKIDALG